MVGLRMDASPGQGETQQDVRDRALYCSYHLGPSRSVGGHGAGSPLPRPERGPRSECGTGQQAATSDGSLTPPDRTRTRKTCSTTPTVGTIGEVGAIGIFIEEEGSRDVSEEKSSLPL